MGQIIFADAPKTRFENGMAILTIKSGDQRFEFAFRMSEFVAGNRANAAAINSWFVSQGPQPVASTRRAVVADDSAETG